jgi:hypothetical protein
LGRVDRGGGLWPRPGCQPRKRPPAGGGPKKRGQAGATRRVASEICDVIPGRAAGPDAAERV